METTFASGKGQLPPDLLQGMKERWAELLATGAVPGEWELVVDTKTVARVKACLPPLELYIRVEPGEPREPSGFLDVRVDPTITGWRIQPKES